MSSVVPLLKHNPAVQDPAVLEAITVQREPVIAELVDCVLETDGGLRHQLLIGPRGMGKTHILSLVASRARADARSDGIVIAWLDEDPWAIRSYDKFLAAILAKVGEQLGDADLRQCIGELRASDGTKAAEGEDALRKVLGDYRLVLLIENLDEVFRRIGEEGQAKFRALLENWRQLLVLATSPQLFADVQRHESPFYGFFAITHLRELSLESATELMRRVADLRKDDVLREYLGTELAVRRLAAVEALAGGHPRIWLLLAGCISVDAIDELVPMFLEALDDLTPYYQDRLRELSDQQQEIVVLLSEAGGALSNRALAERSGIAQNQIATILRHLNDRGYIRPAEVPEELGARGDNRMSYWELREPLMRLCLDVKQARGEPLRMVVEFLRAWYGAQLIDELVRLSAGAGLAAAYVREAFRALDEVIPIEVALRGSPGEVLDRAEAGLSVAPDRRELQMARVTGLVAENRLREAKQAVEEMLSTAGSPENLLRIQLALLDHELGEVSTEQYLERVTEIIAVDESKPETILLGAGILAAHGRGGQALSALDVASEVDPDNQGLRWARAIALRATGQHEEALEGLREMAEKAPRFAAIQSLIGDSLARLGRDEEALASFTRALELDPDNTDAVVKVGNQLRTLGRYDDALEVFDSALCDEPGAAILHAHRGTALAFAGRAIEAIEALDRATSIDPSDAFFRGARGAALMLLGRQQEAVEAMTQAVDLDPDNPQLRVVLGEFSLAAGRAGQALDSLREGVVLAGRQGGERLVPDAEFLCRLLWRRYDKGEQRRALMVGIAEIFKQVETVDELGHGIVSSIPALVSDEFELSSAEAWIDDWDLSSPPSELEIPLAMLRAAVGWKRDRDRAHLLALPLEQRRILIDLLGVETVDD